MTPTAPDTAPAGRALTTFGALSHRFAAPAGKLCLLYGDPLVFPMSLALASRALVRNMPIAVVDGCNRFDAHSIARFARERSIDPDVLLHRIFVSRGFTCYQMEAAITKRLSPMLERVGSRAAFIFGLLDTFYDEQAPFREVTQMLDRVVAALHAMRASGVSVLLASKEWNVLPKERNRLFATLTANVDNVYRLEQAGDEAPQLFLEQPRRLHHGTYSTDVYQHHRQRGGELVKIPAGPAERGPGSF